MDIELFGKVIEAVAGIEVFLGLLWLRSTLPLWRVQADEFVSDAQFGVGNIKERRKFPLAIGKTVGELETVIRLDAFHPDAPAGIPLEQLFSETLRENRRTALDRQPGSADGRTRQWRCTGTGEVPGSLYTCVVLPSHPPESTVRDRSSAHKA